MKDAEGSEYEADNRQTKGDETEPLLCGVEKDKRRLAAKQVRLDERKSYICLDQNSCIVKRAH